MTKQISSINPPLPNELTFNSSNVAQGGIYNQFNNVGVAMAQCKNWETVTAANIQAEYCTCYIMDGATPQTITLPAETPGGGSEGKWFAITGQSSQLFTLAQNLSQSINGIEWSTTSGVSGGLKSLNRNCTLFIVSLFDTGLIFKVYAMSGYFENIGQNQTIFNNGVANFEDGELLIGDSVSGYPQRGTIGSVDGSIVVTNNGGSIDLSSNGIENWEEVTAPNTQAQYGKAYILSGLVSQDVALPLPAAGSLGKGFAITGASADDKTISQNAGQLIRGVDWETNTGTGGGVRAVTPYATMMIVATNDGGTEFKAYSLDGYFENQGTNDFFNSDGLANIEDGQLMIGNSFNARPQPGVISSNDGSVIVTNGNGTIDLAVSAPTRSYGHVKLGDNASTGYEFSFGSTAAEIILSGSPSYSLISSADFTNPANGRLQYTGTATKMFLLQANIFFIEDNTVSISFALNGTNIAASTASTTAGNLGMFATINRPVSLSTNDVISVFAFKPGDIDSGPCLTYELTATEI